jgi:hypothetical protein
MSENENTKEINATTAAPLNEDELKDVSGGLWGITITDTCIHEFDFDKCCDNFGKCPNLVVKKSSSHFDQNKQEKIYEYLFSCAKGYFYNARANMNTELPSY